MMHRPNNVESRGATKGMAHFAIFLGDKAKVDILTEKLRKDGYKIASEPRMTGDGYYESAVLDPEGNYIELTSTSKEGVRSMIYRPLLWIIIS